MMITDRSNAIMSKMIGLLSDTASPADASQAMSDFIKLVCDIHAKPTDGLCKSQASLIWQRQIALKAAARAYGSTGPHVDLLGVLYDEQRTVWDADRLDALADDLMAHASLIADEMIGEGEVLRGVM